MKNTIVSLCGLPIVLSAIFSLCSLNAYAAEHEIRMVNMGNSGKMVFEPAVLQVAVGDRVTFIPTDPEHDSISVVTPKGANTWHGQRNERVTVTINKEGVYLFKCAPHFYFGMVGLIQAGEALNLNDINQAAAKMSAKFVVNQNRLKQYLALLK
jgi:pseudoazurin